MMQGTFELKHENFLLTFLKSIEADIIQYATAASTTAKHIFVRLSTSPTYHPNNPLSVHTKNDKVPKLYHFTSFSKASILLAGTMEPTLIILTNIVTSRSIAIVVAVTYRIVRLADRFTAPTTQARIKNHVSQRGYPYY